MRWFGLACFLILLVMAGRKKDLKNYALSLGVGCLVGFGVDCFGIPLGLWYFPGQTFLSWKYFIIVIPCWGIFGATINMINDWSMKKDWWSILLLTVIVTALYEIPNLLTSSWQYQAAGMIVVWGWFPLIIVYRLSFLMTKSSCIRRKLGSIWEYEVVSGKDGISGIR